MVSGADLIELVFVYTADEKLFSGFSLEPLKLISSYLFALLCTDVACYLLFQAFFFFTYYNLLQSHCTPRLQQQEEKKQRIEL